MISWHTIIFRSSSVYQQSPKHISRSVSPKRWPIERANYFKMASQALLRCVCLYQFWVDTIIWAFRKDVDISFFLNQLSHNLCVRMAKKNTISFFTIRSHADSRTATLTQTCDRVTGIAGMTTGVIANTQTWIGLGSRQKTNASILVHVLRLVAHSSPFLSTRCVGVVQCTSTLFCFFPKRYFICILFPKTLRVYSKLSEKNPSWFISERCKVSENAFVSSRKPIKIYFDCKVFIAQ